MGLTGVMFAVVVVAWAMYLVPMALRRHDQAARTRSIEKFSSTMRVLARSNADSGEDRVVHPSLRREQIEAVAAEMERPTRGAMKAAAARRRRVVVVLLAITAIVAAVSGLGYLPWWAALIPATLVVAFLWLARRQVRLANDAYWEWVAAVQTPMSNVTQRSAVRVDASHGAPRSMADTDDEPTVTLTAAQVAAARGEDRVVAVSMQTADGESLWDPLPVTLPTYVDKPVARRTIRTIELSDPSMFSSGHDEDESAMVARAAESADDATVDTPRAANA